MLYETTYGDWTKSNYWVTTTATTDEYRSNWDPEYRWIYRHDYMNLEWRPVNAPKKKEESFQAASEGEIRDFLGGEAFG